MSIIANDKASAQVGSSPLCSFFNEYFTDEEWAAIEAEPLFYEDSAVSRLMHEGYEAKERLTKLFIQAWVSPDFAAALDGMFGLTRLQKEDKGLARLMGLILIVALTPSEADTCHWREDLHQTIPVSRNFVLRIAFGLYSEKDRNANRHLNTGNLLERIAELSKGILVYNSSYSYTQEKCREFTVRSTLEFLELKEMFIKSLTNKDNPISVLTMKPVSISKTRQRTFTETLAQQKQEIADSKVKALNPRMFEYRDLVNDLYLQGAQMRTKLHTDAVLLDAYDVSSKYMDDLIEEGKSDATVYNTWAANNRSIRKIREGNASLYKITKDLSPRVFDSIYQGITCTVAPTLWKGCLELDFSRSQLCTISQLMPSKVFDKYLAQEHFWDVLIEEVDGVLKVTIKMGLYTITFGGGWGTIKKELIKQGQTVEESDKTVASLKTNPLFVALNEAKSQMIAKYENSLRIEIDGTIFSIFDFVDSKKSSYPNKAARSAMAHKVQYTESMEMYETLKELKVYNEEQTDKNYQVYFCCVKHDGFIFKPGIRVKGKVLTKLIERLQNAANKEARRLGLQNAPKLELKSFS